MTKLILSLFIVIAAQSAFAEWIGSTANSQPVDIQLVQSDAQKTIVKIKIYGFNKELVTIGGKSFYTMEIPGLVLGSEKGMPAVPMFSKSIMIPNSTSNVVVKMLEQKVKEYDLGVMAPSRGSITRNMDATKVAYVFNSFYKSNNSFPTQTLVEAQTFQLRDIKGVNIQLNPVQYNAQTQKTTIIEEAVIEVQAVPSTRGALNVLKTNSLDQNFESLYKTHFINYQSLVNRYAQQYVNDSGKVLIISNQKFVAGLKAFVDWKTQKGLLVKVVTLAETGGSYGQIKAYIQKAYNQDKISYVILVGDAEFMPTHPGLSGNAGGNEADPMYGLVDGTDSYPDLFVSRISVKTTDELENVLTRSINYEKNPDINGDWYSKGVGIASEEGEWSGLKDFERTDLLRDMMMKWHYNEVDQTYDPNANSTDVLLSLNAGRGYINYIGHGSETEWVSSGFSNSDIDRLSNGSKLPFIVSVACVNGDFNYYQDSFAEKWLKAGTTENPKGAVSIFASSTNQEWIEPTVGQKEITELLIAQKMNTIGSLFFHGSIKVLEAYGNNEPSRQTFETWHIFGDATLQVRTQKPSLIEVTAMSVNKDALHFEMITEPGIAVGITDQDGKLVARGIAGTNGKLMLPITEKDCENTLKATLTGFNKIPQYVDL